MTATRIVEPGLTVMFTRRTVARFYLLRPDRRTRQIFLYCLGVAAERHGILLHALVVMSTHYHLVATDVRGVYPDFLQELNRLLANCTKVARGWPHQVFDSSGTHVLDLLTPESIADKCGYTVANPVACGAVRYARDWPGIVTRPSDIGGRTFVVDRPDVYFDDDGDMLERVSVRFVLPPACVERYGEEGARQLVVDAIEKNEDVARAAVREKGYTFLGADRVKRCSPFKRATEYEVFGALRPRFSTKGGGKQAYLDAVARLKTFLDEYREAWTRWCAGEHEVVFPYGTWLMRVRFGARCADPPGA